MFNFCILYYISIALIAYSLIFLIPLKKVMEISVNKEKFLKLRRIYYAISFFIFSIIFNSWQIEQMDIQPKFGIPKELWIFFISFLIFVLIVIILDIFIISAKDIKSLSKSGISFEETQVINSQGITIDLYEDKIEAEYEIIRKLDEYVENIELKNIVYNSLKSKGYIDSKMLKVEIGNIVEKYLNYQQYSKISFEVYDLENLNEVKEKFNIDFIDYKDLQKKMEEYSGYINNKLENKILCIPYFINVLKENVIIILYSKQNLLIKEHIIIQNLLTCFERKFYQIATDCADMIDNSN